MEELIMEKDFKFNIPIDIFKGRKEGEWRIGGIASDENSPDLQGEQVMIDGLDTSYLLQRGSFNWDHGKNPGDIIGEIDVARKNDPSKLYVEGFLYPDVQKAKEVHDLLTSLSKAGSQRKLGLSLEGKVKERDEAGQKIKKAWIKNVAVTYHPINQGTFVDFVKSLDGADIEFEGITPIKADIKVEDSVIKSDENIDKSVLERIEKNINVLNERVAKFEKMDINAIKFDETPPDSVVKSVETEVKKSEEVEEIKQDKKVYEYIGLSKPTEEEKEEKGEKVEKGEAPGSVGSPSGAGLHAGSDSPATSGGVSGSALRTESLEKDEKVTTYGEETKKKLGKSEVFGLLNKRYSEPVAKSFTELIFGLARKNSLSNFLKSEKISNAVSELLKALGQVRGYIRSKRGKLERVNPYSKEIAHEAMRIETMAYNGIGALMTRVKKMNKPDKLLHFYAAAKVMGMDELLTNSIKRRGKELGLRDSDFESVHRQAGKHIENLNSRDIQSAWERKHKPKPEEIWERHNKSFLARRANEDIGPER